MQTAPPAPPRWCATLWAPWGPDELEMDEVGEGWEERVVELGAWGPWVAVESVTQMGPQPAPPASMTTRPSRRRASSTPDDVGPGPDGRGPAVPIAEGLTDTEMSQVAGEFGIVSPWVHWSTGADAVPTPGSPGTRPAASAG